MSLDFLGVILRVIEMTDWKKILVILLLVLIPLQAIPSMLQKSVHGDELYHITSGYSKLKTYDFRLLPEHGPLTPMISPSFIL